MGIRNMKNNKVLDTARSEDGEQVNLEVHPADGHVSQQWEIIYADKWVDDPKKGELNK